MKTIKQITAILLLIVGLLVVGSAALASDTAFDEVKVNDVVMTDNTVYVERGETIDVDVQWTAGTSTTVDRDDLKLNAWIGGYEYDDVEDTEEIPNIDAGNTRKETLQIILPEDMDAKEKYKLHVRLYNEDAIDFEEVYSLKISQEKHKLSIQDVILRPNTVTAGNALFATIWVENMGYEKEENIEVTVSIPDLGVSAREHIAELVSEEDTTEDDDEETSGATPEMRLTIPSDAKIGDYNIDITMEYNRGHNVVKQTGTVHVRPAEAVTAEDVPQAIVSVDGAAKDAVAGTEVPFKIMVANLDSKASVFSVEVAGADLWAATRTEPAMVTLAPDSTGEMYVYVKPKSGIEAGKHSFTVKVKAGNAIVAEKTLTADVAGTGATTSTTTGATTATNGQTNFASLKNALVIGFGVLVVLLVILGLIIAFNKMSKDEEEEIPTSEGQAYY
ncbi:MAG: putative S-layer protein [Nanoarchaeota archaeon]|nr:putative S-layer protein [Nanoarchaeota archaeon]